MRIVAGTVYVLESNGRTKIGYTCGEASKRIQQLQTGNPYPIRLAGCVPGPIELEREAHRHFGTRRGSGEWFDVSAHEALRWLAANMPGEDEPAGHGNPLVTIQSAHARIADLEQLLEVRDRRLAKLDAEIEAVDAAEIRRTGELERQLTVAYERARTEAQIDEVAYRFENKFEALYEASEREREFIYAQIDAEHESAIELAGELDAEVEVLRQAQIVQLRLQVDDAEDAILRDMEQQAAAMRAALDAGQLSRAPTPTPQRAALDAELLELEE